MGKRELYKQMRSPTSEEHMKIYAALYKKYRHAISLLKLMAILFLSGSLVCTAFAVQSMGTVDCHEYIRVAVILAIFSGISFAAHEIICNELKFARSIKKISYKVYSCVVSETQYGDYVSGDSTSTVPQVKVQLSDNTVPDIWFDTDSSTMKKLKMSKSQAVILVSDGITWQVLIA